MTTLPLKAVPDSIAHPAPKLLLAIAIALVGDNLFYGHALGISLALFLALVAAAALACEWFRPNHHGRGSLIVALVLLIAGLTPLVETVGFLPFLFGVAGLSLAVTILTGGLERGARAIAGATGHLLMTGPFQLPPQLYTVAWQAKSAGRVPTRAAILGWLVPIACCSVFVVLLSEANPLLEGWLLNIPWAALVPGYNLPRTLLWLALLTCVWGFIAPKVRPRATVTEQLPLQSAQHPAPVVPLSLLAPSTIQRCLVLFNLLFAVQSFTDAAYLWAGFALPTGVTYAAYAHRGSYPLIATALLAAAFVLIALRPGSAGERSPTIRILVGLWIGQNVLLVVSAMRRLDLYVEAYGLSVLRLSALIWMALVAVGLALILARVVLQRGNGWLVRANGLALAATLYVCAFVNFSGTVADYNADRSLETKQRFDAIYALNLGAEAIPAIDRVLADGSILLVGRADDVVRGRSLLVAEHTRLMRDWRAWTFRNQRLSTYLDAHPDAPSAAW